MRIRLSGEVIDSIVDGPGLRLSIFTQGCPHRCPGCHNPHTHDFQGGYVSDTDALIARMKADPLLSGITLSGGEPFAQAAQCLELALGARALGLSVWVYSGYTYEELTDMADPAAALLRQCDVLVDGRYDISQRSLTLKFRGSRNQRLIDLKATLERGEVTVLKEM